MRTISVAFTDRQAKILAEAIIPAMINLVESVDPESPEEKAFKPELIAIIRSLADAVKAARKRGRT